MSTQQTPVVVPRASTALSREQARALAERWWRERPVAQKRERDPDLGYWMIDDVIRLLIALAKLSLLPARLALDEVKRRQVCVNFAITPAEERRLRRAFEARVDDVKDLDEAPRLAALTDAVFAAQSAGLA